jgi:TonB family protein
MFPSMTGDGYFQETKKARDIVREKAIRYIVRKILPEKFRTKPVMLRVRGSHRYPRLAMERKQQGAPWVRFVIDCDGKVLSVGLERSSGFPDLDREALTLPKRAQPLPNPLDEKPGDTIELVAPVEFFLTGR